MSKKKNEPTAILSSRTRKKSIMQSVKDSMARAYSFYSDFCEQTSLHGLKHTVATNLYFFERFLWFILTVAAFAGATYCALNQLTRYISEPVVVSLQRDYRSWSTAFPAVTICYLERVDVERAREFIGRTWHITEDSDPEKYQYYYEFLELIAEVSFRRNLQNFWKYQNDDSVNDIDLLKLATFLHPDYPLESITSDERNVQWVQVMTEEGLCKTFNGQYAQYQKVDNKVWKPLELMTCHYHSEACYVSISTMTYGARYFIHSPFDIATAISNPTGDVFSGDNLVTDYKVVEIEAASRIEGLTAEQRRCKYPHEWLGNSIRAYSFGLCQMHCRTRLAIMFCGCRPYFHVKGASLGGTTALFVGASVLTVVEMILFIIRHIVSSVVAWHHKRKFKYQP